MACSPWGLSNPKSSLIRLIIQLSYYFVYTYNVINLFPHAMFNKISGSKLKIMSFGCSFLFTSTRIF